MGKEHFEIVVTTLLGLENVLQQELEDIGVRSPEILGRAVKFFGNQEYLYRCNYELRTGLRVLRPLSTFKVHTEDELYRKIQRIDWSQYLNNNKTFAVDATTYGTLFTHSKYVALKTKDAIVDQFRDKTGARPSIDVTRPSVKINVHIAHDECTISLDSSGTPLSKRGYKTEQTFAPLSEVLAAGMILKSNWDKNSTFYDPMCGSGTIAIEAALIATQTPPGGYRNFGFETWFDFDAELYESVKLRAESRVRRIDFRINGSDMDENAIEIARNNARRARISRNVQFFKADFLKSNPEMHDGVIIMNPPYGERIGTNEDMISLYQAIGDQLKTHYSGADAWILSGNIQALKLIGLAAAKRVRLNNGPIECKYHHFPLYKGSKEEKVKTEITD